MLCRSRIPAVSVMFARAIPPDTNTCDISSLKPSLVPCDDPLVSLPDRAVNWVVVLTGGVASAFSGAAARASGREDGISESGAVRSVFGGIGGSALSSTATRERRSLVQAFFIRLGCCDGSTSIAALEGTTGHTTRAVDVPAGGGGGTMFFRGGRPLLQPAEAQSVHFQFAARHLQRDCFAVEHLLVA